MPRGFVPTLTQLGALHRRSALCRGDPRLRAREARGVDHYAAAVQSTCPTTGRPMRSCGSEPAGVAGRAGRSGLVSAARSGAARAAGTARGGRRLESRRGCWPPTNAASFPGIPPSNRSSGGRPIRAWCCFPTSSRCSRSLRKTLAQRPLSTRIDQALRRDHPRLRRAPPLGSGDLAQRGHDRLLRAAASLGIRPLASRPIATLGWSAACTASSWAGVLRRIDVQPGARRLQSGLGASDRGVSRARHPA